MFFGDINITTVDGKQSAIPVAVKPHEDDVDANESCLQDYTKNLAATQAGIYTLSPVGFINGRNRAYSITRRINYAPTLDSIDWSNYYPNIEQNPGMNNIWSQVARQAAMLHSMGNDDTHSEGSMMHGDLAARNIAQSVDGSVFFLDWERAHISLQPSVRSLRFARHDLNVLIASMCTAPNPDPKRRGGIGIFTGKDGDWVEGFRKIFFEEYAAYCMSFAKPGKQAEVVGRKVLELERGLQETFDRFHLAA